MDSQGLLTARNARVPESNDSGPLPFIRFRRRSVTVGELLFEDRSPGGLPRVDLFRVQWALEAPSKRMWTRRHTLLLDLERDEDELFGEMAKGTRYEVRRAMTKDAVEARAWHRPPPDVVSEFADRYDEFARAKSLSPMFRPRLEAMAEDGLLTLTNVSRDGESPLAWHAYASARGRACLVYSASQPGRSDGGPDRSLVGRANRYLHWADVVELKDAGYTTYDLGGVDVEARSEETARIAKFKKGFGGRLVPTFSCSVPGTAKGRAIGMALRLGGIAF